MITVLEVIKRTTDFLAGKGIDNARLNAEHLVGHALGLKRMQLYLQFERPLTEPELEEIRPMVRRRGLREPLQYIVGETDFFGLKLKVDRRALIPRPETEYLLELVTQKLTEPPATILDLGTGSGAIALGLARHYPNAQVVGVDVSAEALALATENAVATGLGARVVLRQSDWFAQMDGASVFDLIVANPPYLSEQEVAETELEVRGFEPQSALTPGGDGSAALDKIIRAAHRHLTPTGLLALETGIMQHPGLLELLRETGYARTESLKDLAGRDRFVLAWRS